MKVNRHVDFFLHSAESKMPVELSCAGTFVNIEFLCEVLYGDGAPHSAT